MAHYLAWAVDVTGDPRETWPERWQAHVRPARMQRWLGSGPSARRVSLLMLVLAALLLALLAGAFAASWSYSNSAIFSARCDLDGCPPFYPTMFFALAGNLIGLGWAFLARYLWLRHIEARSGVWLRFHNLGWGAPLYYVRRPETTTEAAAAALARCVPEDRAPLARVLGIYLVAIAPYWLMLCAGAAVSGWLRLHWIPG
jgi:hypothetical protein